jgi:uncharacterized membrane protein YhaH (DUF805 family)
MEWLARLLSFTGRSTRKPYWLTILPFTLLAMTGGGLTMEGEEREAWMLVAMGVLLLIAAVFPMIAVSVRRLHDRGRSGWWLVLYWVIPMLFGSSAGEPAIVPLPHETLASVFNLLSIGLSVWALVDLGFLKGEPRENRFGPDPLGRGTAEVFA